MSMPQEEPHLLTLSKHKHIYDFYMRTQEVVGLAPDIKNEIFEAYKVENPNYHYTKDCSICIIEMLVTVYRWYENKINTI